MQLKVKTGACTSLRDHLSQSVPSGEGFHTYRERQGRPDRLRVTPPSVPWLVSLCQISGCCATYLCQATPLF